MRRQKDSTKRHYGKWEKGRLILSKSISLEELAGLCDEISALSKAGMPLESSLELHGNGKLGQRLRELGKDLESGTSLVDLVRRDTAFPPFYAVAIEAGMASNNISGILDSVSALAQQVRDVRYFIIKIMLYPLFLFTFLWLVLMGVFCFFIPIYPEFYHNIDAWNVPVAFMEWIGNNRQWLMCLMIAPVLIPWLVFMIWVSSTRRCSVLDRRGFLPLLRWIPWTRTVVQEVRKTLFVQNLTTLLEASVPFDRALDLAEESFGDGREKFPAIINWAKEMDGSCLLRGLRIIADDSCLRAKLAMSKCEIFLPPLILLVFAAMLTMGYFFVIEWPYLNLYYIMGSPLFQ